MSEETEENHKNLIRNSDVRAENWIQDLPNMNLETDSNATVSNAFNTKNHKQQVDVCLKIPPVRLQQPIIYSHDNNILRPTEISLFSKHYCITFYKHLPARSKLLPHFVF
jgi:hypothetical protein